MALADPRGVVAIGASAGGIDALQRLVRDLPAGLRAALCVVVHIPASARSLLPQILARQTALPVQQAVDGDPLRAGHVYVAPPDCHVLVRDGAIRLDRGPKENGVRPAIDPLLRSLAAAFGERAIAVVVSGSLSDGAAGAAAVAAAGGAVLVQDPADAIVPSMPEAALAAVPAAQPFTGVALAGEIARRVAAMPESGSGSGSGSTHGMSSATGGSSRTPPGPPSGFTCPECHGPLWEVHEREVVSYRCRVGHVFGEDVLIEGKAAGVEAALWMAVEALEERRDLLDKVAGRMDAKGSAKRAGRLRERARSAGERAELIRGVLTVEATAAEGAT